MKPIIDILTKYNFFITSTLIVIMLLLLSSCTFQSKKALEAESILQQRKKIEIKKILHESYYLKHRIKDCNDRMKFMKAVVKPSDNLENELFLNLKR